MADAYERTPDTLRVDPAIDGAVITPNDGIDLLDVVKAIHVGTGGNIRILTPRGTDLTFKNLPSGSTLNWGAKKVFLTGTTATDLVGATR